MTLKEDVAVLTEVVSSLVRKVEEKEKKEEKRRAPGTLEKPALPADYAIQVSLGGPSEQVPSTYRAAVDQELNKDFGVHLKYDGGRFTFTILVPEKYSSLNENQRNMLGFDMRPKVIDNAEGVNGVLLWCQRVFSNFSPAIQAQIVSDRIVNP